MRSARVTEKELTKVKNKTEAAIVFEDMSVMNRANSLAIYELLGDANMMNTELEKYRAVTIEDILSTSRQIFDPANSNTLYYRAQEANGPAPVGQELADEEGEAQTFNSEK